MDWIEVTAKTVDDAKELALDRLGVVEDELEFEVVDEPTRGLFRRTDARIRARVKPISREKPNDRSRRRRSGRGEGAKRGGSGRGGSGRGGGDRAGGRREGDTGRGPKAGAGPRADEETATATDGGEGAATPSRNRRRRGGRGRGGGGARTSTGATREQYDDDELEHDMDTATMPIGEQADHARTFTDELVRTMGFSTSVRTEVEEDDITVHIEGSDLGLLVGPKGATMQAIEEVVRASVQRHAGGRSARVHIDVAGYRQRRRDALAAFARQVGEEVLDSGTAKSLEPMNAADRKLVHDTISEIDGLATSSEGEDPRRRVVIRPA